VWVGTPPATIVAGGGVPMLWLLTLLAVPLAKGRQALRSWQLPQGLAVR
jgi:hypothetical protein